MKSARLSMFGVMSCIAMLATAGCGPSQDEKAPTAEMEIGTAESAATINPCGTGCPSGYYPVQVSSNPWCGSSYGNVSTTCNSISGSSINPCGTGCPSGYYPVQVSSNPWCGSSEGDGSTTCPSIPGL